MTKADVAFESQSLLHQGVPSYPVEFWGWGSRERLNPFFIRECLHTLHLVPSQSLIRRLNPFFIRECLHTSLIRLFGLSKKSQSLLHQGVPSYHISCNQICRKERSQSLLHQGVPSYALPAEVITAVVVSIPSSSGSAFIHSGGVSLASPG